MRARLTIPVILATMLVIAISVPAGAKEFGTIYIDGEAYRTFGNPARVDPGTGIDPIISFTNFDQGGVAQNAPGDGSHGGRWMVFMATWDDPTEARLVTSYGEALDLEEDGDLTIVRAPEADFRCPVLPARGNGNQ